MHKILLNSPRIETPWAPNSGDAVKKKQYIEMEFLFRKFVVVDYYFCKFNLFQEF